MTPEISTQVSFPFTIFLPEEYVPETVQRLTFYKRIAAAGTSADLEEAAQELRERFGPLPGPARRLVWAAELRLAGRALGLARLDWRPDVLELTFHPGRAPAPEAVAALLAGGAGRMRTSGESRLSRRWLAATDEARLEEARDLLRGLAAAC